jgi:hypothetical protein
MVFVVELLVRCDLFVVAGRIVFVRCVASVVCCAMN